MDLNLTRNVPDVLDFTDSYMRDVHNGDQLHKHFAKATADVDYDTLVGTGLSGTIAVVDLARRLGKHYLVVRKENDQTHSFYQAEGKLGRRWLFVDDFVESGATLGRVYDRVGQLASKKRGYPAQPWATEFVGVYEYKFQGFSDPWGEQSGGAQGYDVKTWHELLSANSTTYDGRFSTQGAISPAARCAEADLLKKSLEAAGVSLDVPIAWRDPTPRSGTITVGSV